MMTEIQNNFLSGNSNGFSEQSLFSDIFFFFPWYLPQLKIYCANVENQHLLK